MLLELMTLFNNNKWHILVLLTYINKYNTTCIWSNLIVNSKGLKNWQYLLYFSPWENFYVLFVISIFNMFV